MLKFSKAAFVATVMALVLSLLAMPSAQAAGPEATISKLKLDKKGRPGVKVKANVDVEVLIAPPMSDDKPKFQKKGTKVYRLPKISKGNSVKWAVIVYYKGEILAERSDKPLTWARWMKMSKKCDRREPLVIVGSTRAKTAHVKVKGGKPTKLIDVARENGETAFGGKTLSGKKTTYMVTMSPGRPKVYCK